MSTVRKAVIPVAGLAVRMRPVSAVLPKAMLPLVEAAGRIRTVLHWILAEVGAAGIDSAVVVASPGQRRMIETYLAAVEGDDRAALPEVRYIPQPGPGGFGDAVARASEFTGEEPFMVLLGDAVYTSAADAPGCAAQVLGAFEARSPAAMIGVQVVAADQLPHVGVCAGQPLGQRVFRCTEFIEKPDADTAAGRLVTPGLPPGRYLAHAGLYVFTSEIYSCLAEVQAGDALELADAQSLLLGRRADEYLLCRIDGRSWDVGTPRGYAAAQAALGPK